MCSDFPHQSAAPTASPKGEAYESLPPSGEGHRFAHLKAFPRGGRAPVCAANKYAGGIFKVLCGFAAGEMPDVNQASTTQRVTDEGEKKKFAL